MARRRSLPALLALTAVATTMVSLTAGPVGSTAYAAASPPANDDKADARVISGRRGALTTTTVGATPEYDVGDSAGQATVWFRWRATHTGWETFDTRGSQAAVGLTVYPPKDRYWANLFGSGESDLYRPVPYPHGYAKRYVRVVAGKAYRIKVLTSTERANTVRLSWYAGGPPGRPGNDDLANARVLTGDHGSVPASIRRATYQPGESLLLDECGSCGYTQGDHGPSIWFRWTAPSDGFVRFDSGPDPEAMWMSLYRGGTTIASLTPVSEPAIGAPGLAYSGTVLDRRVTAGTTYVLRYSGFSDYRAFPLRWRLTPGDTRAAYPAGPANDGFAAAQTITGSTGTASGTTSWSTLQPGEPQAGSESIRHSVWYRWTAPTSGLATLGTVPWVASGARSHTVDVWTGSTMSGLTAVAPTYWGDPGRRPTVEVTAGQTYHLQVGTDSRSFDLTWDVSVPANDDFADAATLPGGPRGRSADWSVVRATAQPGEPAAYDGRAAAHSVWMRWTPERSGRVSFDTFGDHVPSLDVFTGSSLGGLTRVDGGPHGSDFRAEAGTTYRIRLNAELASTGYVGWRQSWDETRPTAGASLDGGAGLTRDTWVSLRLTGGDSGSGLRGWYVSMVATDGEVLAGAWVPADGASSRTVRWSVTHTGHGGTRRDGAKTVYVQAVDRQGNLSRLVARTITLSR